MLKKILAVAVLSSLGLTLSFCGTSTTTSKDAGTTRKDAGVDAGHTPPDAATYEPPDASTPTTGTTCGTLSGTVGQSLTVTLNGNTIDLNGGQFDAAYYADGQFTYYDWYSADNAYLVEVIVWDGASYSCPATLSLPLQQTDPYSIVIYDASTFDVLAYSDGQGASGSLTIDAFNSITGQEEISWSCSNCNLVPLDPPDAGSATVVATINGSAHGKM